MIKDDKRRSTRCARDTSVGTMMRSITWRRTLGSLGSVISQTLERRAKMAEQGKEDARLISGQKPGEEALFHDQGKSPKEKLFLYLFVALVVIMVGITLIISLVRGSTVDSTYLLLGISIISIGFVQGVLIHWSRTGELPAEKLWFLYLVGTCLILESIFTDVLLYHEPTKRS